MIPEIETLAYQNKLRKLPPEEKLFFGFAWQILALISSFSIQIVITLWVGIWLIFYAKIPLQFLLKLFGGSCFFLIISAPAFLFSISSDFNPDLTYLFTLKIVNYYLYISRDNLELFASITVRSLSCISALIFIILTTPFLDIIAVLNRLKVPKILTDLLFLIYRFIFVLAEKATTLKLAQQSRGGYNNQKLALKSISLLISNLFKQTMIYYQQVLLVIKSRNFNGEFNFLNTKKHYFSYRYLIEFLMLYLVLFFRFWQ